jgi:hypothetical protein
MAEASRDDATVKRYLLLGLRLGRHVEGAVDAYFGPPELASTVEAEPLVEAIALVTEAESLLDELDDGWLRDQVVGLRTYAGVLAGEPLSYSDEVGGCYGVRPEHTNEQLFAAVHDELETLLPGGGSIAERFERWEASIRMPTERIEQVMGAAIEEARAQTRRLLGLPEGDGIELEIVRDVPCLLRVPRRSAQPDLRQRRPPHIGARASRHHDARDVPGPSRGALLQGAKARPWRGPPRRVARDGAHAAIADQRGDRDPCPLHAART